MTELAKPVALAMCLGALCCVFNAAFLTPSAMAGWTPWDTAALAAMATGMCVASGMLFREGTTGGLLRTLPMQVLFWSMGLIAMLWIAAWYLETYCVWYRDVRRF